MNNLSFFTLAIIFIIAAAITWIAGIILTKTTDTLDTRYKLGDAIGGLVILGISGSLPELAVVYSAAQAGHISVIIGNLLGGIAIQTLILIIFDFAVKGKRPLSFLAGSPMLALETSFALAITALALIGTHVPATKNLFHYNPLSFVIVVAWLAGLFLINKARKNKKLNQTAAEASPGRKHHERRAVENHAFYAQKSNLYVIGIFLIACLATLIAGVALERTGTLIAEHIGMSAGIFAATIIALVTSLPEISTGLESILIGDNHLAISDIMGGNAFMIVIFIFADFATGKPVLSFAENSDKFFGFLGVLMMAVYAISFLIKPARRYFRLGLDSILTLALYIAGLLFIF